jgi:hypothetical protein
LVSISISLIHNWNDNWLIESISDL